MHLFSTALFTAALALTGCTSAPQITSDYDPHADASQYRTYGFASEPAGHYQTLTGQAIQNAVQREMQKRGYHFRTTPDLVLYDSTMTKHQIRIDTEPTVIGWGGYSGWTNTQSIWVTQEGSLTIDVVDRLKNQLVWRGTLSNTLPAEDQPVSQDQLAHAVTTLFTRYPFLAAPTKRSE